MTTSAKKEVVITANIIVDCLESLVRDLRQSPSALIVGLRVGRPAAKELLKRARARPLMPHDIFQLASRMNGFRLVWTSRPGLGRRQLGGRVEVPTLARQLKGWEDFAFNEDPDHDIGVHVVDTDPMSEGQFACFAGGDLGIWHGYDDTFQVEGFGLADYFAAGVLNLFVPGWLSHVLEDGFDSMAPEAIEARELLGLPPPEQAVTT